MWPLTHRPVWKQGHQGGCEPTVQALDPLLLEDGRQPSCTQDRDSHHLGLHRFAHAVRMLLLKHHRSASHQSCLSQRSFV